MKLLRLIGGLDPEHGGPPVSSVNACIAAQRAGAETTFAFPIKGEPHGALADTLAQLRAEGVEIRSFPYSSHWGKRGKSWGISRQLARWINNNYLNFDIVHCHGSWQMATFLVARRSGTGPALVLTPHESMTNFDIAQSSSRVTGLAKKWLRHYYAEKFDLIVLSSSLEANDSVVGEPGNENRAAIVPHPVFDQSSNLSNPVADQPFESGLRLGYLGRLHAKKNVDIVLQSLAGLDDTVTLTVAGDGPEHDTLKALSTALGIDHRVRWMGFIDKNQKKTFFHDINILLMPSDYECFGMAAAEAMIDGVPVVTSPATGIGEIIRAQGGGEIVAAEPNALRTAIENLARNPQKIVDLARCAAKAAHKSLSFAAYGATMKTHYDSLMKG